MCDWFIFEDCLVPDQYNTQQMCDKAVDDGVAALTLVSDWFITSKMIKKNFTALYADENILCFDEDSGNFVFVCNWKGFLNIGLNNINLDDKEDPDIIIHVRLLAWHIEFEKCKELKKKISEELMLIV